MVLSLNKFTDMMYVNLVRQVCMCRIPTLRPIAFKVGEFSNVATIGTTVEEDMSEFISNVNSAVYMYSGSDELVTVDVIADEELFISDLVKAPIQLVNGNRAALHPHSPVNVRVVYRNAAGVYTSNENRDFLKKQKVDVDGLTIVNSRHCAVRKFQTKEKSRGAAGCEPEFLHCR